MPRIPDDLLDRIKQDVSLVTLVERRGVALKKHGDNLLGLCPLHEDHDPSLVISPTKNLWHCLGACQTGGSTIDWVMKSEGLSFRHAVEILRSEFFPTASTVGKPAPPPKRSTVPRLASPLDHSADDRAVMLQVVGYYNDVLKQSPEALTYLESRGLRSSEVIDRFMLGYANRTLGYRLPGMGWKSGQEIRLRLQKLGVFRGTGHEHFSGSLVVPVFSEEGDVAGIYGRKIRDDLRPGTAYHLYLPGPHRGVFNVQALGAAKEVILCEALIDALTFWCAGHRNVTASYGVEGFTPDHLDAFKRYGTEHVLIAYDRDEAGDRAAGKLAERLMAEGVGCSRILFPKGMDANEYALKVQPAEKSLGVLIRSAEWLGNGRKPAVLASRATLPSARSGESQESPKSAAKEDGGETVDTGDAVEPLESPAPSAAVLPVDADEPGGGEKAAKEEKGGNNAGPSLEAMNQLEPLDQLTAPAVHERLVREAAADVAVRTDELDEFTLVTGDRRYRIRGLRKNLSYGVLKLNLLVSRDGVDFTQTPIAGFFVDDLNLYSARQRAAFEKQAAHELGVVEDVVKRDLGQVLKKAEALQEETIRKALEPKQKPVVMSEEETAGALELLRDPRLLSRILQDFERAGVVGEETNKLTAYLAATSRKLERPLAVIIQSSSAAGKSSLMEAVLSFMPEEEREKYSALTGMSLFYMQDKSLRHKILAIVEEEGAERATYALKLLQSEGELTIASTGKETATGRLVTQEYRVEGPVMIFLTTTAVEIDEELLNRCLVLTVDESREQTRAIHRLQRQAETIEGHLAARRKPKVLRLHQNAQRLLRPLAVHNPYAERLTFLDEKTRTRRDHVKYLTLIRSIALLHQYQRPVREVVEDGEVIEYIDVTREDIAIANRLASEVLGRSLDELPPQTRRFLLLLDGIVTEACVREGIAKADYRFTGRLVRQLTGWTHDQIRIHLGRLVSLEYVLVHRGGRGQSFVYELLYEGQGRDGRPFLMGLLDVEGNQVVTVGGETATVGGESRGSGGSMGPRWTPVGVGVVTSPEPAVHAGPESIPASGSEKQHIGERGKSSSYRSRRTHGPNGHRPAVALNLLRHPPIPLAPRSRREVLREVGGVAGRAQEVGP